MDKTKLAVSIFDRCAKDYEDKFMDQDQYEDSLSLFCRRLEKENAAVLELACGPGNITRYLLQRRPDLRILATDLSVNMLELARKNNPGAEFRLLDAREVASTGQKYDGIVCGFGLPYLSREEAIRLIRDVSQTLYPGGLFYLSTVEGDYGQSGLKSSSSGEGPQIYFYYHQTDYMMEALAENGLELLDLNRKVNPEVREAFSQDLVLLARRNRTP